MYPPPPRIEILFKHEYYRFLSILVMGNLPSLPTYISSLSKTVKRKHVIFNFKWKLKCKKGPLSPQKSKCLFLDNVQLLMIGQAIQATKVDQNAKIGPLGH